MNMLHVVKKADTREKIEFKRCMQCLYQKGIILDIKALAKDKKIEKKFMEVETCVNFIPIDGEATK